MESLDAGQAPNSIDYESLKITRKLAEAIESATLGNADPRAALDKAAVESNMLLTATPRK